MNRMKMILACALAGATFFGCGDDDAGDSPIPPADLGTDGGRTDMGQVDMGAPVDGGPVDSGPDLGPIDLGGADLGTDGGAPAACTAPVAPGPAPTGCADPASTTATRVVVAAAITASTTWTCNTIYVLEAETYVENNSVLTINAGTTILGDTGALIVTQGSRIEAVGHPDAPIVFTSSDLAAPTRGDWGGLVMLGSAPINVSGGTAQVEGIAGTAARSRYGGTDNAYNCGTLRYVRVEYAGKVIGVANELNGITLAGCGTATTIDYVQSHGGLDDGIEVFGGSVNLKHVVVSTTEDDGLDWDLGWTGNVQFAVLRAGDAIGEDRGFESDNNPTNQTATPISDPQVWNVTLLGPGNTFVDTNVGMLFKNGTRASIHNALISGYPNACFGVQAMETANQVISGELQVSNSVIFSCGATGTNYFAFESGAAALPAATQTAITDAFMAAARGNRFGTDPALGDTAILDGTPDFAVPATSPLSTGGGTPPAGGFFLECADFVGAFEPGQPAWTDGWTNFAAI